MYSKSNGTHLLYLKQLIFFVHNAGNSRECLFVEEEVEEEEEVASAEEEVVVTEAASTVVGEVALDGEVEEEASTEEDMTRALQKG